MDYRRIVYFLNTAETLNFSKSASQLCITPQALSRQISLLEEELGDKLFNRNTRKVELTETGHLCVEKFAPIKKLLESSYSDVKNEIQKKKNILKLGFLNALPKSEIILPIINLIQTFRPETELDVSSFDIMDIVDALLSNAFDFVITLTEPGEEFAGFASVKLLDVDAKAVISMRHPWVTKDKLTVEDLESEVILQLRGDKHFKGKTVYNSINWKGIYYVENFDSMLINLENANCFAIVPPLFEYKKEAKYKYFDLPKEYAVSFQLVILVPDTNDSLVHLIQHISNELDLSKLHI
ncbi:LysR family transcriptional regulator [Anaerobium acetethylicum]|uniref:DNA-binding transcriptional regulator, LysR family n=1 Tax=Anaerobium acetethylicum TaxID=1619234 RepID=A0A1D3TY08_9FIRM|nr:LysR family transcriptional regulator [Anaerobium acetethylicum]SCP99306.1 DNA-binding transcriptional regulator, LysR family [Anaerobium acetethylicum]